MSGFQSKMAMAGCALALGLAVLYKPESQMLRQLYYAGASEVLLVRHGSRPVAFRLGGTDHENRVYIPAGEFIMGGANRKQRTALHTVYLDAYWIDQFEVTNAMFEGCVKSGKCGQPAAYDTFYGRPEYADYPTVYVTWWAAQAFCAAEGGRLPTEAEWEKAARGTDDRPYPWGTGAPDESLANFDLQDKGLSSAYDHLRGLSPYGLLNMAGNAREWVSDWYAPNYYLHSPYENPQGPSSGTEKSLRGGSYSDPAPELHVFHRTHHDPNSAGLNRGFRCAYDAK
jgi:formylglycine-generating enzyme required for sulfatase activity